MAAEIGEGAEEVTTRDRYRHLFQLRWPQDPRICQEPESLPFPVCSDLRKAERVPPFPIPSRWLEQSGLALSNISKVDLEGPAPLVSNFPGSELFPLLPQLFPRARQPADAENSLRAGCTIYDSRII